MRSRKSHQPTLRVLLLALLFGALLPSNAWAIQVKLRINWPLGGSYSVKGLDSLVQLGGFGLGLAIVLPIEQDVALETGYEYNNGSFTNSTLTYQGNYTAHIVKIGASYSGVEITDTYNLIVGGTLDLPLSGQAEVTRKSDSEKASSSSFGGIGFFGNVGVSDGQWDMFTFYRQRTLSYGLTPPGKSEKLKWTTAAYGLGVGYTF